MRKNGWVFTSDAPAREPMRRSSSLIKSLRIRDLQRLKPSCKYLVSHMQIRQEREGPTVIFAEHLNALGKARHRGEC